jgi:hypothetical protein
LDQNEIFTLAEDKSKETELTAPQARMNMGVFGDFNVNVVQPSTSALSNDNQKAKALSAVQAEIL